jgi:hypothetical protein
MSEENDQNELALIEEVLNEPENTQVGRSG